MEQLVHFILSRISTLGIALFYYLLWRVFLEPEMIDIYTKREHVQSAKRNIRNNSRRRGFFYKFFIHYLLKICVTSQINISFFCIHARGVINIHI